MGPLLRAFFVLLLVANASPHPSPPRDRAPWSRLGGGVARIEYTLPKAGHVRVIVFDANGREVARPVNERQRAGTHVTSFAFGPDAGPVFTYRVECDGRRTKGKITVAP